VMAEFVVDRRLYPFESRWFDGRRGRIHNIDEGQGPPIVFFHGNPTWSFLYRNVITRLRRPDEARVGAGDEECVVRQGFSPQRVDGGQDVGHLAAGRVVGVHVDPADHSGGIDDHRRGHRQRQAAISIVLGQI
jgi:hypothetical protein